jgi:release factor glutamine methyltransferase
VYLETHEALAKEVMEVLKKKGFGGLELRKDMQGKDRMVKGVR